MIFCAFLNVKSDDDGFICMVICSKLWILLNLLVRKKHNEAYTMYIVV